MSKIENKAGYYFGDRPVIEKAANEDEFEGSFTTSVDLELLEQISVLNLSNFWKQIWIEFATLRCTVTASDTTITLNDISPLAREKYPYHEQQIWAESVNGARKKGWDWSGDTDIYVRTLNGPKNLSEAVISLMISEYCGEFWMDRDAMIEPSEQSRYNNWKSFWNDAFCSYENDLPEWKGKPERDLVLKHDGNTRITLAQKSVGNYVVVHYYTS
eukprot:TRINITY_DN4302_c0_g1_i1.p1 TRINITY_DN4302_c0_g1~~TRINITY_DN4302_c0_g1_i1.p1  ORF type:complete len:215 (-),score=9.82 TRINITY_DN4302_c0_g1_i1:17-661(-)